jgi:NAD(P)-dependent dehydrogenase (short-subunit alcohol dehydrogenase family)
MKIIDRPACDRNGLDVRDRLCHRQGTRGSRRRRRHARTRQNVEQAKKRLVGCVPQASVQGIAAGLSTGGGVAAFAQLAPETDILVNNLGFFEPKPFESSTDDDWRRFFDTNVMSGIRMSRHYLPAMVRRAGAGSSSSPANPVSIFRSR